MTEVEAAIQEMFQAPHVQVSGNPTSCSQLEILVLDTTLLHSNKMKTEVSLLMNMFSLLLCQFSIS